jgi:hypothetical protein
MLGGRRATIHIIKGLFILRRGSSLKKIRFKKSYDYFYLLLLFKS